MPDHLGLAYYIYISKNRKERAMENKTKLKLKYNAPVVLTFFIVCFIMLLLDYVTLGAINKVFMSQPSSLLNPLTYVRLFTHVICHSGWEHFFNNMMLFIILGPMLEEKYGSKKILATILITAVVTSIINNLFFNSGLLGASGVIFMFIILSSLTAFKEKEIPLTFIFVLIMYLGQEVLGLFKMDNISQLAHILGGICGAIFGFILNRKK